MNVDKRLLEKRDNKTKPVLEQNAPVWLVDEQIIAEDEAVLFTVMFLHPHYGWVNRRYRYDGFNNVLYYKGQTIVPEDKAIEIQEQPPYLSTTISDVPNAYGG